MYWSLMFLFVGLSAGLRVITFTAAGVRKFDGPLSTHFLGLDASYSPLVEEFAIEISGGRTENPK